MLEEGASVDVQDKGHFTPLHLATLKGHVEVINKLLENHADIDARTTKGNTPLHLAAESGNLEVVEALIAKNANVDLKNEEGKAASDFAYDKGHLEVNNYIIQHQNKEKILISQTDQDQQLKFISRKSDCREKVRRERTIKRYTQEKFS